MKPAGRCGLACDFEELHPGEGRTCSRAAGHIDRASSNDSLWHLCPECSKRSIDTMVAECDQLKETSPMPRKFKSPAAAVAAAAPTVTPPATEHRLVEISVVELFPSGTNPRKTFDQGALHELAASIRAEGLIQPITVRPMAQDMGLSRAMYEIVSGERRYRASKLAGRDTVTCVVRDLTDEQALLIQLAENAQRSDVHPLEEAEGYRQLLEMRPGGNRQAAIERIADEVGKAPTTVAQRLQLCALTEAGKAAYLAGEITGKVAVLLARIPDADTQTAALEQLAPRYEGDQPRTEREAKRIVSMLHMHPLADATFNVADAKLVVGAGACSTCPYLAGNARMLFAEEESPDATCTKPSCWELKTHAAQMHALGEAQEQGLEVVETKKVFQAYGDDLTRHDVEWVILTDFADPNSVDRRTWGEFLGEHVPQHEAVAIAPSGKVVPLWKRTSLAAAARAAKLKMRKAPKVQAAPVSTRWESPEQQRADKVHAEAMRRVLAGVRETMLREGPTAEMLRAVLDATMEVAFHGYEPGELRDAWSLSDKRDARVKEMTARWSKLDVPELLADLAQALQCAAYEEGTMAFKGASRPWMDYLGKDAAQIDELEEAVLDELNANAKAKPADDDGSRKAKPAKKGKKA